MELFSLFAVALIVEMQLGRKVSREEKEGKGH